MTDVRLEFKDKKTGNKSEAEGSDGRLDVSSRTDGRPYFVSRDDSLDFLAPFEDASAAAGDYCAYIKNDDITGKDLVVNRITLGSANAAEFKVWVVTGTASGTSETASSTNRNPSGSANATVISDAVSGLTASSELVHDACVAGGRCVIEFGDTVRLGKDQALAVEYDTGTTGKCWGTIFFFFEEKF